MDKKEMIARMDALLKGAKGEGRSMTAAERREFDDLDRKIIGLDSPETRGASTGAERPSVPAAYKGDSRTEGRKGELLRPDQSMTAWAKRRGLGKGQGTDRDYNRYWAERMGLVPRTAETRALGEDTSSGSGAAQAIVPQEWSTSFIDLIRPNLVLGRAGATLMPMETETTNVPQYVADVAPAWIGENTSTSLDANPAFSPLQFVAKGAYQDITLMSREVAEDTNQAGGLSALLQDVIGRKYQRLIDQVGLYGTSGNAGNPGLVNESGLVVQTMGTNGAAPSDPSKLSIMAEAVRVANAEPSAIVANPQTYGTFMRLNASTYAKWWELSPDVASLPWIYSTTLASNETLGTGTALSSVYMGDWSRIIIGMRVDLDVTVLRERYADQGSIGLWSYMRFSIRATHPETFVRLEGVVTT